MTPSPGPMALREVLQSARRPGVTMKDLTVLATQNDPYRVDTPAGHRDGAWFAEQMSRTGRERLHLRGAHYAVVARGDVLKPNGQPYRNTDADWKWLSETASKAARWLGYVPFDAIPDRRNDPPVIHRQERLDPWAYIHVGVEVEIPDAYDLKPRAGVADFEGRQPYHLVIFGEKSSLADVIEPIAERFGADLYLPTGEISDTLLYQMAKDGAEDGRPMQVFTLADCDPAGHQMPVSIGRKLQALRDLYFQDLDFEVRPVALTVDQVHDLDLPSTPLKATELRADKWRAAFGIEQTEIDALETLRPDVLEEIVVAAIEEFIDPDLDNRVFHAETEWRREAQAALDARSDAEFLDAIRARAGEKLAELEEEIAKLNESLRQAVPDDVLLPAIRVPDPEMDDSVHGSPLVSSRWSYTEQTRALIRRKSYGEEAA